MRFAVTGTAAAAAAGGSKARVGVLHAGVSAVETPALILSTRKGLPSFMSKDILAGLPLPDSLLLHCSPVHFIDLPSSKTITNLGGLHGMVGLQEHVFVATAGDSVESLPSTEGATKLGASFETPSGRRLVKPSDYMGMISSMKPDLWATLADEVPAWVSKKRNALSIERTLRWLDDCLTLDKTGGANTLGVVVGGCDIEERRRCASEVSTRNVAGFFIGGFGLGESMEERDALIDAVTDCLPDEKLRFMCRLGLPEEVLQGVAAGIDLFDSSYIYHVTLGGFALIFPFDITEKDDADSQLANLGDSTKINLRGTIYRTDLLPIVEGCTCFTCRNHTRAYINHLLNVHEMLAQILLEIHNTHHYLKFFQAIREAIKNGKFELFRQQFIRSRRAHQADAVPCQ